MGVNIKKALKRARSSEKKGYTYSYDMLGEGARTQADAESSSPRRIEYLAPECGQLTDGV